MTILVCGSVAFDTIMVFQGQFKQHILPEQIRILNVSFLVPEMRREFGGCAGNIAYSLALLGGQARILATVGEDAGPYLSRLDDLGIDRRFVRVVPGTFTAQAFITTDLDDNQITAFHPGAMSQSHTNRAADAESGVSWGIVSPDGRDGMLQHARDLHAAGIPFVFDPGQALPILSREDLLACIDMASLCTANDYEAALICNKTGLSLDELANRLDGLIVTYGADGSRLFRHGESVDVRPARPDYVVDPTGCGDAYRAGLLFGLSREWDLVKSARLASVMGAIKIGHQGAQNHAPNRDEIARRFADAYGEKLW
ncbi:MAG: carbohydrate kinase family protein [Rhodocyclaceae bacterium]